MCHYRALAARIAVVLRPDLPAAIARDAVQHNWASYPATMRNVIIDGDTVRVLNAAIDALKQTEPANPATMHRRHHRHARGCHSQIRTSAVAVDALHSVSVNVGFDALDVAAFPDPQPTRASGPRRHQADDDC